MFTSAGFLADPLKSSYYLFPSSPSLRTAAAVCPRLSLFSLMRKVTKRIKKKRNSLTLKQSFLHFL
ncbi:hypothetical protein [Rufibacter roseolus]|uniref:hypothetical protein n=1 Tax=Rufibacter roseolus TaxID=2817375 RepID=UPI003744022F